MEEWVCHTLGDPLVIHIFKGYPSYKHIQIQAVKRQPKGIGKKSECLPSG